MAKKRGSFGLQVTKHEARLQSALRGAPEGPIERRRTGREDEAIGPDSGFRIKEYALSPEDVVAAAKLGDMLGDSPPAIKTGGYNDTRNDVNADGKYLLFAVPNFNEGRGDPLMSTYLRLGAACSTWDTALGNELEKIVHLTGPVGKDTYLPFIDDERLRGGAEVHPGVGATLDQSLILHNKGGWRDHSDGNRITTTYGDKIEVIRGNYKMVVLGRQDGAADSAGWDLSGQHVQDWGYSMPGASVTLEWVDLYGGTWLLKNSTEIFHSWNRTAGNLVEQYWGEHLESYVGQEDPLAYEAPAPDGWPGWAGGGTPEWRGMAYLHEGNMRLNPHIVEKTFAESMTSQTGSAKRPVPTIKDDTWATVLESTTTGDSFTDVTTIRGSMSETTNAGDQSETFNVDGTKKTTVSAGAVTDTTTAGAITDTTTAGSITETTVVGAQVGTTVAGAIVDTTVTGAQVSTFVGTDWSLAFGTTFDLFVGVAQVSIAASILGMLDVTLAGSTVTGVTAAGNSVIDATLTTDRVDVYACTTWTEAAIGARVEAVPDRTSLSGLASQIAGAHFHF